MISRLFFLILFSYIIGSIPSAYILAKILRGIDIRKFGSGNVGATNAFRVLGAIPGIIVLTFDFFKGLFCVVFLVNLLNLNFPLVRIISGLFSVFGHNWTIFLGFKGGKGVATTLGVLSGLALKIDSLRCVLALTLLSWIIIFSFTHFVSLASILSSITLLSLLFFFPQPKEIVIITVILCLLILIRHRSNIIRLLKRREPKTKIF